MAEAEGPLKGIRVLDIGTLLAGPFAATLMAEFGAEVIKVELPGTGDELRKDSPEAKGVPLWWMLEGRNKKSITLNLSKPEGQQVFKKLVPLADIVVENFSPGTLERWNLGYEVLQKLNPGVILVRVSGFGQDGPYRDRMGYDRIGQAMGGLVHTTGFPDSPPALAGVALADYSAALFATIGALVALRYRDTWGHGQGQVVDSSICESMLRMYQAHLVAYDQLGVIAERKGNVRPSTIPGGLFKSKDGKLVLIAIHTTSKFAVLAEVMGRKDLAQDPRLQTKVGRWENQEFLNNIVSEWVATKNLKELMEISRQSRFALGPVYNARDIAEDEHYRQRETVLEVEHPVLGKVKMQGIVPKLSMTPGRVRHLGRTLGEDTDEVLSRLLGYGDREIAMLRKDQVI